MFSTHRALALFSIVAALGASAAQAEAVRVSDIDLTTHAGTAAYQARVDRAAQRYCRAEVTLGQQAACRQGVVAELSDKLQGARDAQIAERERATRQAAKEPAVVDREG